MLGLFPPGIFSVITYSWLFQNSKIQNSPFFLWLNNADVMIVFAPKFKRKEKTINKVFSCASSPVDIIDSDATQADPAKD